MAMKCDCLNCRWASAPCEDCTEDETTGKWSNWTPGITELRVFELERERDELRNRLIETGAAIRESLEKPDPLREAVEKDRIIKYLRNEICKYCLLPSEDKGPYTCGDCWNKTREAALQQKGVK